jgi:hypothetical protein
MLNYLLNSLVTVQRRVNSASAPRDSFNNPVYGAPTATWPVVYTNMPCRLAFSGTPIEFSPTGERVKPSGVVYYPTNYTLFHEDRILVNFGYGPIEYIITSIQAAYQTSTVISHMEANVELP